MFRNSSANAYRSSSRNLKRKLPIIHRLLKAPARFLTDGRGTVSIFATLFTLPMIGLVGLGADAGRVYMAQARLSAAVDAAALAGAKDATDPKFQAIMLKFFNANFPASALSLTVNKFEGTFDTVNGKVNVSATATVPTSFMHLFGVDTLPISANAVVVRQTTLINVVLSIDMSGSMGSSIGGTTKIASAREAAKILADALYGSKTTSALIKLGVVPWNGNVNILKSGKKYNPASVSKKFVTPFKNPITGLMQDHLWKVPSTTTSVKFLNKPDATWKGCVYARYIDDGIANNDADAKDGAVNHAPTGKWKTNSFEARNEGGFSGYFTPCLSHGISALNPSKTIAVKAIDALQSPTGYTNIAQGLMWAWRVVSPDKAPFTEGTKDKPGKPVVRGIVLLSDGANCSAPADGYKGVWGDNCSSTANKKMDERLKLVAAAAKAKGIYIYVIQFGNNSSTLATLLKGVASGTGAPYYHYAPDGEALKTVFKTIADSVSELRISE